MKVIGKVNGENGCPEKSSRRGRTDGRAMAMSAEQRGALELLAGSPHGCTESIMMALGCAIGVLRDLVHDGLATAAPHPQRGHKPAWRALLGGHLRHARGQGQAGVEPTRAPADMVYSSNSAPAERRIRLCS
jgi:hypothetical protein